MKDLIMNLIRKIWKFVKKVFVKTLNFFKHILSFVKEVIVDLEEEIKKGNLVLIVKNIESDIGNELEKGNYTVVECLFDKKTEQIYDFENRARIIHTDQLDEETKEIFKDKDMIILK